MDALKALLAQANAGAFAPRPIPAKAPLPIVPAAPPRADSPPISEPAAPPSAPSLLAQIGVQVTYLTEPAPAAAAVARLRTAEGPLGLDIETAQCPAYQTHPKAGLDPRLSRLRLVQIYDGAETVAVFDIDALGGLACLAPLWDRPLIAHNALFEAQHLRYAGIRPQRLECTLLQAHALTGARQPKLADLAQEYLGWLLDKRLQVSDWGAASLSAAQVAYAALDAVAAQRLWVLQAEQLKAQGLERIYRLMREAQHAIAQLILNGCPFDGAAHQALMDTWAQAKAAAKQRLDQQLGPGVNLNSAAQLAAWLETHLEAAAVGRWPRTDGGQLKTDADTLALFSDHPLVAPLKAYKEASKRLSTYGAGYAKHLHPVTGRIHAGFMLGGTETGRLSCGSPNLQNPPRDPAFRALFKAPPGRVLVVADFGQIELRVAALLSGDPRMLAAYTRGEDLHRQTAAAVLGCAPEAVTSDQRQMAKAVNFGLLFGQGAKGLAAYAKSNYRVAMTERVAKKARRAFFQAYPELARWQRQIAAGAERTLRVRTPGGRVRDFTREGGYGYTKALNTPVQGGAAEILLAALACLDEHLRGLDARLVNVVHDELVLEVAEADAPHVCVAVEAAMTAGYLALFPEAGETAKGLVEAHVGLDWAAAKG